MKEVHPSNLTEKIYICTWINLQICSPYYNSFMFNSFFILHESADQITNIAFLGTSMVQNHCMREPARAVHFAALFGY